MYFLLLFAALAADQVYEARVVRVVDGDNIRATVVIFYGQEMTTSIRVRGVDAPELRGKCPEERELARHAKAYVEEILPRGSAVSLSNVARDPRWKGRHLAVVTLPDGRDMADLLLSAGHARVWHGRGPRPNWCPSQ